MDGRKGHHHMVKIGVARDQVEAAIWRDALEREGIHAFFKNIDPLAIVPYLPDPLLPYSLEVFVPASDERRARWILGLPPPGEEPAAP